MGKGDPLGHLPPLSPCLVHEQHLLVEPISPCTAELSPAGEGALSASAAEATVMQIKK